MGKQRMISGGATYHGALLAASKGTRARSVCSKKNYLIPIQLHEMQTMRRKRAKLEQTGEFFPKLLDRSSP